MLEYEQVFKVEDSFRICKNVKNFKAIIGYQENISNCNIVVDVDGYAYAELSNEEAEKMAKAILKSLGKEAG